MKVTHPHSNHGGNVESVLRPNHKTEETPVMGPQIVPNSAEARRWSAISCGFMEMHQLERHSGASGLFVFSILVHICCELVGVYWEWASLDGNRSEKFWQFILFTSLVRAVLTITIGTRIGPVLLARARKW